VLTTRHDIPDRRVAGGGPAGSPRSEARDSEAGRLSLKLKQNARSFGEIRNDF
jgi:hypothetical protein